MKPHLGWRQYQASLNADDELSAITRRQSIILAPPEKVEDDDDTDVRRRRNRIFAARVVGVCAAVVFVGGLIALIVR